MRHPLRSAAVALAVFAGLGSTVVDRAHADPVPAPAGVGSCFEPKPVCIGNTHPVCVCDVVQNCFWACR